LLFYMALACLLWFVANLPFAVSGQAQGADVPLDAVLTARLYGNLLILPLILYALAAISRNISRLFGGTGSYMNARLALFWAFLSAMPAVLAEPVSGGGKERNRWMPVLAAAGVLALVWAGGEWRLAGAGNDTVPGVRLRLVQPNIPQKQKWKQELRRGHVLKQLEMSNRPAPSGWSPTHVIWPETAVPFVISGPSQLTRALGRAAPPGGLVIVGAPRTTGAGTASKKIFNSLLVIDSQGRIKDVYDKHHLVPFGEYVPFRSVLPLGKLTAGRQDFSPGPGGPDPGAGRAAAIFAADLFRSYFPRSGRRKK